MSTPARSSLAGQTHVLYADTSAAASVDGSEAAKEAPNDVADQKPGPSKNPGAIPALLFASDRGRGDSGMTGRVVNRRQPAVLDQQPHSGGRDADDVRSIELAHPACVVNGLDPSPRRPRVTSPLALEGLVVSTVAPACHLLILPDRSPATWVMRRLVDGHP